LAREGYGSMSIGPRRLRINADGAKKPNLQHGPTILFAPVQSCLPLCTPLRPSSRIRCCRAEEVDFTLTWCNPLLTRCNLLCPGAILFAPTAPNTRHGAQSIAPLSNPLCPGAIFFAPVRVLGSVGAKWSTTYSHCPDEPGQRGFTSPHSILSAEHIF
jgi:hypothetical protein